MFKNFKNLSLKITVEEVFLRKVEGLSSSTLIEMKLPHRYLEEFSLNFVNIYLQEHL